MIKIVLKILLISFILTGIGLYVSYLMTGNLPNFALQKANYSELDPAKIAESATNLFDFSGEKTPDTKYLYKWRDAKGIIHYTSEKPAADIEIKTIKLSSDTNIVPAVSAADTVENPSHSLVTEIQDAADSRANLYTPQGIEQLFEEANDEKNLMNERYDQQNLSTERQ